jgi:Outer membrane protein beta-barrel domain
MRKVFIVVLFFIAAIQPSTAQDKKRTGFRIGFNYSSLRAEVLREKSVSDFKPGLSLAIFQDIPLNKTISFQPALAFNRFGGESDDIRTKLDYVSIPTLFKFHGKHLGFVVGPQVSLLVKAKQKEQYQNEIDLKNELSSVDVSAVAGLEYSLGKKDQFVIAARYLYGVNNIAKEAVSGSSLRNQAAQLTVGFQF